MQKLNRLLTTSLSLLLSAAMVVSIPVEAYAASAGGESEAVSSFDGVRGEAEETGSIVAELPSERTAFSKTFLLDDGTKMIAQYDLPVHYQNENGEWTDYNNSLAFDSGATSDEAGDGELSNKSSNVKVKLSNKAKKNNMVKVTSDDYSISWGYDGVNKSKAKTVAENQTLSENDSFLALSNLISETVYEDAFKNVDLQYLVLPTGVKENIILKSSDVQNEFGVTYKVNGLTAEQTDDYTITLLNKSGDEVYQISVPYMTDAKGETSTQLKLSIESQKGGNLNLKLTADYWFIHSIGRSFPVAIDPEITIKTASYLSLNEAYKSGYLINHGPFGNSSGTVLVAKANKLCELEDGERIISAKYNFTLSDGSSLFANADESTIIVNAHKITKYMSSAVTYSSEVLDYDSLTYSDNEQLTFDLTRLYKEWYENGDEPDGFVLESVDTIGSKQFTVYNSSIRPTLTLIYKDFTGTESWQSSHTFSAGQNASASVNDYLGSLSVSQTLYQGTGSRMPVNLTATYNSINYSTAMSGGNGWQFSFNQSVRQADETLADLGYDYIYQDGDGTDHYLKKSDDSEEWYDEDGIGITLTKTETNLIVEGGTTQTYQLPSEGGGLLTESDEYGNTVTYSRANGKVTGIQDGAGRNFTISYSSDRVSTIKLPDNNIITFAYSNGRLTAVTFPDNRISQFVYNSAGRLSSVKQADKLTGSTVTNSSLSFTYTNAKVTKVTEYGKNSVQGGYLSIAYGTDNTTVFTDRQGRSATYTFDNEGSRISVLNANGYLESDGGGFSISGGAESFTKNYITQSTNQNSSYYSKINGDKDGVTSSGGTVSFASDEFFFGSGSIKVNNPVSSNNTAFFTGAMHQFGSEFNGQELTFSAYVKTKDIKKIYSGGAVGAILKIKCFDASGNRLKEVNSVGISDSKSWQRLSISAVIPNNTSYFRIYCMVRYASGTAWFDCLQLEEGGCANDFNALKNGDFASSEYWKTNGGSNVSPQNGTVTISGEAGAYDDNEEATEAPTEEIADETQPATYTTVVTEPAEFGVITERDQYGNVTKTEQGMVNRTVRKTYLVDSAEATEAAQATQSATEPEASAADTADSLGNKYIYQEVEVGKAGVIFNLVGQAQAKSVPLTNENRTFGIALNIYYQGESTPETHYQEFNNNTEIKQTVNLTVYPEEENKVIEKVAFAFVYGYNKNTMNAYNAMLNIASTSYSASSESESTSEEETEDTDNYIDYEVISETLDGSQSFMRTSTAYDSTGNYAVSETNELGNIVSYTYDANGNVTETAYGSDYYIDYEYDSSGNVTKISTEDAENVYSYNGAGNISAIDHNNFRYSFNYDVFNNLVSTKIGNVAIASNTYSANNGNLTKTTYANGDYIEYTYDEYDNIIGITGETGSIAQFVYNKKGLVSKVIDDSSETITYYYYDFNGNVIGEYRQTAAGDLSYYLSYDEDGNQIEKTSVNGQVKTITTGTDDNGNEFVSNDGVTVKNVTDDFGRKTAVKTSRGENTAFYTDYEYANGTETKSTTNYVSKIIQKFGNNELVNYEYAYDSVGNVKTVKENGNLVIDYEYDDLNQLYIINDKTNKIYTHYYYDDAGNITSVLKRGYNSYGVPSSKISEDTYTYGDSNWKDKLTAFNGQAITYDEMGNPLSYRDGMSFTWVNGRKLNSVTVGNTTLNMKYDSNGMRTQKGDIHYYYDSNKNLIALTNGNNTLFFYYDSDGNPTSFAHNGTMYYYIKNLQGDIVKIVNESGSVIANYAYDVSGEILSIKDNSGNAITDNTSVAIFNPYRYRGYVYDDETGLYYLQSRYYDPVTERFLNADIYCDTDSGTPLSTNMFCYCENNIIMFDDLAGSKPRRFNYKPISPTTLINQLKKHVKNNMALYFYYTALRNNKAYCNINMSSQNFYNKIVSSKDFQSFLKKKSCNNLNVFIKNIIKSKLKSKVISDSISFYNSSKELYLSIGECGVSIGAYFKYNISNKQKSSKWKIIIKLYDLYNFEKWSSSKKNQLTLMLNNYLGYYPQVTGIIKPYYWYMEYSYEVIYFNK